MLSFPGTVWHAARCRMDLKCKVFVSMFICIFSDVFLYDRYVLSIVLSLSVHALSCAVGSTLDMGKQHLSRYVPLGFHLKGAISAACVALLSCDSRVAAQSVNFSFPESMSCPAVLTIEHAGCLEDKNESYWQRRLTLMSDRNQVRSVPSTVPEQTSPQTF